MICLAVVEDVRPEEKWRGEIGITDYIEQHVREEGGREGAGCLEDALPQGSRKGDEILDLRAGDGSECGFCGGYWSPVVVF